jgi:hypothetical protein
MMADEELPELPELPAWCDLGDLSALPPMPVRLDATTELVWLQKLFMPILRRLIDVHVNRAVEQATATLVARCRALELELSTTRAAVKAAVAEREAA